MNLSISLELTKELEGKLNKRLKKDKLSSDEYLLKLLENELNSIIDLGEGFYFNDYLGKLYNPKNDEVKLTRTEKEIILALLAGNGEIISVEVLIEKVWKKDNASIFTFRNFIKKIRDKSYYGIIKSKSNLGYSINI